jgi:hypothetical protein
LEQRSPNAIELVRQRNVDLVLNIPKNYQEHELTNDYLIRRQAADFGIPLITNIQLAQRFVEALSRKSVDDLQIKSWGEYASSCDDKLRPATQTDLSEKLQPPGVYLPMSVPTI